jgi:hypothetical protein
VSIPVNAKVRAVPNFLVCLRAARAFMEEQDVESAPVRFKKLQMELAKARELVAFAPTSGRPARFLDANSGWGRFQAEQARQLAAGLGMPDLRELVLARHILLYAHSEREVVLLSLRHERELGYGLS